ncbi:MAG TPA: cytochrome c biogenesis protein CcsA [Bacteriovoracaceae bacterium]|nr:cytochrome c biogenesis protein CcsA [Bacteriovoracaceae bacterium]
MSKLMGLLVLLFTFESFAQLDFCNADLETFPVQAGGRDKPFYVLATEGIRFISGDAKVGTLTATEAFCQLTMKGFGIPSEIQINIKVDHPEVKTLLRLQDDESNIPATSLANKMGLIEAELVRIKENNSYRKELNKVDQRYKTYLAITQGRAWTIPVAKNNTVHFVSAAEFLTKEKVLDATKKSQSPVQYIFEQAKNEYLKVKGDGYLLELKYYKWNLFLWSMLLSLIGIFLFVVLKNKLPGTIITVLSLAVQVSAMAMRVMISGRAPVTNMYETVMFSGFGALVIGCIITLMRKEKAFVIAGLAFNFLTLMMMKFANGMLDPGISPLVPVLRDNFWLSTHVTTVILSYAALALSWVLANSILIRSRFFKIDSKEHRYQVDLIYTCIKFGVVLLATGVILGGIWADYSWGRFWGWDPKETWSLIVLLIYMAILHGKSTSWIPPKRFVPLVAAAFLTVMMAWFGVNYILASGLHSYGFSEGGALFLGSFFLIQILLLLVTTLKINPQAEQFP